MKLNADLTLRAAVHAANLPWHASPVPGIQRRPLHRVGGEIAQATTIVRYKPSSAFSRHEHPGGEEFFVLDGVFQDEYGNYPAGTYVRNPPGSVHAPRSTPGTTLFVKLWQFMPQDQDRLIINASAAPRIDDAARFGVKIIPLYVSAQERVRIEFWPPNSQIGLSLPGGGEFLLLQGQFREGGENFAALSWLRLPSKSALKATTGADGAKVWVKTGHMAQNEHLPFPTGPSASGNQLVASPESDRLVTLCDND